MFVFQLLQFALLVYAMHSRFGWRLAGVYAALIYGVEVVLLTEILSWFNAITPLALGTAWIVLSLAAAVVALLVWHRMKAAAVGRVNVPTTALGRAMLVGIILLVTVSGFVAVYTPPNIWDGLTYHMSRVAHWAHHQNVSHYPTHILRQLYQAPFAEFVILHLYVMAGDDRLANLVQWGGWLAAIVTVSVLARDLSASGHGQLWAALLAATLPMAILQATNVQNDLVLSFPMVAMALFMLRIIRGLRGPNAAPCLDFAAAGVALGLSILTKGNAYPFVLPWLILFTAAVLYRRQLRGLAPLAVCAAMVVLLNLGHWSRNYQVFHSPLGKTEEVGPVVTQVFTNDVKGPRTLVSNVVRNLALHCVVTFDEWSTAATLTGAIRSSLNAVGIDADDRRTTWLEERFELLPGTWNQPNIAGNPLHFIVLAVCAVCAVCAVVRWRQTPAFLLTALTISSFILFCLLLRWQPWHSRLHTPLFFLLAPVAGLYLERLRWKVIAWPLAIGLVAGGGVVVASNSAHPMIGQYTIFNLTRMEQYVALQPDLFSSFAWYAERVDNNRADQIDLQTHNDDPEYLLWVFGELRCVRHVGVQNESAILAADSCQAPCLVVLKLDTSTFQVAFKR